MTPQRLRTKLRKIREQGEEMAEEGGELNLVPYLDIVTNVIMFMLATTTFAAALGDINVSSPTTASTAQLQNQPPTRAEERPQPDGVGLRQGLHHRRLGRGALPGLRHRRRRQPAAAAGRDAADDPEEGHRVRLRRPRQEDGARSRAHRRPRARPRSSSTPTRTSSTRSSCRCSTPAAARLIPKPDPDHPGKMMEAYERFGDVLLSAGVN